MLDSVVTPARAGMGQLVGGGGVDGHRDVGESEVDGPDLDQAVDPGEQPLDVEGLGQVVARAGLPPRPRRAVVPGCGPAGWPVIVLASMPGHSRPAAAPASWLIHNRLVLPHTFADRP